ncbi:hypothetical protein EDB85DRAFT_2159915 [Lactarius pseudohatsudake]|nr:hypothetical protein EDB85DRAFT_2159915 [Lactarius pseudohatsudake]
MLHCFDPLTRLGNMLQDFRQLSCVPAPDHFPALFDHFDLLTRAFGSSARLIISCTGCPALTFSALRSAQHAACCRTSDIAPSCKTSDICSCVPAPASPFPCPPSSDFSVASIRSGSHGMLQLPTLLLAFGYICVPAPRLTVFLPGCPTLTFLIRSRGRLAAGCKTSDFCSGKSTFLQRPTKPSIGLHPLRVLAVPTIFDVRVALGYPPRGPDLVAPHIALDPRLDCFDPFTRALVACCKTSDIYSQANFPLSSPSAGHRTSSLSERKVTSPWITSPWTPRSIDSIRSRGILATRCKTSDICSGKSTFLYICPLKTRILAVPTVFDVPGRFGAIHPRGPDFAAHIALDATLDHFDPLTRDFGNMLQDLRHLLRKEHFLVHLPTNNTSPRCSHRLRRPGSLWGYPSPWPDFVAHITLIPSGLVHHALRRVYRPDVDLHVAPTVADVVAAAQNFCRSPLNLCCRHHHLRLRLSGSLWGYTRLTSHQPPPPPPR